MVLHRTGQTIQSIYKTKREVKSTPFFYKSYLISKLTNSPLYSSQTRSKASILAQIGPFRDQLTISSTSPLSPSKTASTLPSFRFFTQPAMPNFSAFLRAVSRKKTPWTLPDTKIWALIFPLSSAALTEENFFLKKIILKNLGAAVK